MYGFNFIGSFGLSTKEPRKPRNFIFMIMHIYPSPLIYGHQILSDSDKVFKWQPFCYFSFICYAAHIDSYSDFISDMRMYLFFTHIHKRNNVTAT